MSISRTQAEQLASTITAVRALDHTHLGHLGDVYIDEDSQQPVWATVITNPTSAEETFVPLHHAHIRDGALILRCTADQAANAPTGRPQQHLDDDHQDLLHAYYSDVHTDVVAAQYVS